MLWLFSLIRWAGDVVIFNFDQKSDQLRVQWLPSFSGYLFPIQVFKTAYVGFQYTFSIFVTASSGRHAALQQITMMAITQSAFGRASPS